MSFAQPLPGQACSRVCSTCGPDCNQCRLCMMTMGSDAAKQRNVFADQLNFRGAASGARNDYYSSGIASASAGGAVASPGQCPLSRNMRIAVVVLALVLLFYFLNR